MIKYDVRNEIKEVGSQKSKRKNEKKSKVTASTGSVKIDFSIKIEFSIN